MPDQKNEKEFENFFNEYFIPALQYCVSIIKNDTEAEDIVQKTFIKLWERDGTVNEPGKAYLFKSIYNASLDFVKHEKVKRKYWSNISREIAATTYQENIDQRNLQEGLSAEVSRLPDLCKQVFMMSRWQYLSYREIAVRLNITEKKVENQMGKALKMLKIALREYLPFLILINLFNDK